MSGYRKKARVRIRAELRQFRMDVDPRATKYEAPKDRYAKIIELRKRAKLLREQRKNAKFHIGKRRLLAKRWVLENEYME